MRKMDPAKKNTLQSVDEGLGEWPDKGRLIFIKKSARSGCNSDCGLNGLITRPGRDPPG